MPSDEDDDLTFNGLELLKDLMNLMGDNWVTASRFSDIANRHGITQIQEQIAFLSGIRVILRNIPVSVFEDAEARDAILEAAQEAINVAIDAENQAGKT